jgi:hypothetical protein
MAGISDEEILKMWEWLGPMAPEKFAERALRAVLREDAIIVVPAVVEGILVPRTPLASVLDANRKSNAQARA